MNVFWGILESACPSVRESVSIQNTTLCQSASGGIKSNSLTALVASIDSMGHY